MKKKSAIFNSNLKKVYFKILLLLLFSMQYACQNSNEQNLNIATAANMQFVMQELTEVFTQDTGIKCDIIVSSSGKLTAQILEGAPYDVFVSANIKYPNKLFEQGFTASKPKIYAFGKLVIWTMNTQLVPEFKSFEKKHIKHIAMANPKTAPYGMAALEVLKNKGIYNKISKKLVFGESISQTNQFIISYAAEIGITSKSIVLSEKLDEKGLWKEVDQSLYTPIKQGVVVIKNENNHLEKAQGFVDFLFSDKGKEILNKFGYEVSQ